MTELDNYKEDINKYQDLWDKATKSSSEFQSSNFDSDESVKIGIWGQPIEINDNFWERKEVIEESAEIKNTASKLVTFNQFLNSKQQS